MRKEKGFLIYGKEIQPILNKLSDEEAGKLFKALVDYFVDAAIPRFTGVLEFVFLPLQQQMDRNSEKYGERCEKNRKNISDYWDSVRQNTNVNERIRTNTIATNKNKNTNTKTNKNTNTTTNTTSVVVDGNDDEFNIWKKLNTDDIDKIYDAYPNSGGYLIDEVYADVKAKKKTVKNGLAYILGYAKKKGWDDDADHFNGAS